MKIKPFKKYRFFTLNVNENEKHEYVLMPPSNINTLG